MFASHPFWEQLAQARHLGVPAAFRAPLGEPVATEEALFMHVSLQTRRHVPFPDSAKARLAEVLAAHAELATPASLGRKLEIRRRQNP